MACVALLAGAAVLCGWPYFVWVPAPPGGRASGSAPTAPAWTAALVGTPVEGASGPGGAGELAGEVALRAWRAAAAAALSLAVLVVATYAPARAESALVSSKIRLGGASTGDLGTRKSITRGVNLEKANYAKQDLSGVSFQQSIVREANFKDAKLVNTSFFDADLAGSDFTGADLTQANLELARLTDAILTNAVATGMYVNGTTKMEPARIDGADFTDTFFRKDQLNYLCKIATGTNPVTKVDTRESLMCPE